MCLKDRVRRRACDEADVRMRSQQQKIDRMRRVLDTNTVGSGSGGSASSVPSARGNQASAPVLSMKSRMFAPKSNPDVLDCTTTSVSKTSRAVPPSLRAKSRLGTVRAGSPPRVKPVWQLFF